MAKVLIVDDNSDIVLLLRVTFEAEGHEVVSTSDPFEAVPLLQRETPDAMILDIMMPGLSGWDVLREIRQIPEMQLTPVVMLTALSDVNDRVRGLRGGADDYQVKPFEPEEILARLEGLIGRARGKSEAQRPAEAAEVSQLEETLAEIERRITSGRELNDLVLGRYEVRSILGRGAMGTVMEGWDPTLKRPVALKTLRLKVEAPLRKAGDDKGLSDRGRDDRGRDDRGRDGKKHGKQASRLLQEAVANARVNHPNIVTVYDVGDQGEAAFIAMEMVDGESLEGRIDRYGALPYQYVIPLGESVARALEAAHGHEIVHRDIKPANVLLGNDGSVKVTDFGIAEFISRACAAGAIFGTPGYLAPETLTGSPVTPASDLFSLGVTLYECLTGVHPFADENWRKTLDNTASKTLPPVTEVVDGLPPRLGELVNWLVEKDPLKRPQNAEQVVKTLEKLSQVEDLSWTSELTSKAGSRIRVSTTRSRLVTLNTWAKTQSFDAASV